MELFLKAFCSPNRNPELVEEKSRKREKEPEAQIPHSQEGGDDGRGSPTHCSRKANLAQCKFLWLFAQVQSIQKSRESLWNMYLFFYINGFAIYISFLWLGRQPLLNGTLSEHLKMQHRHPLVVEWQPNEGVKESWLLSLSIIADNPHYESEVSDD